MQWKQTGLSPNQCLSLSAKMNGTQRRTLVSPRRIVYTAVYQKAPLRLKRCHTMIVAIIELYLSEGISQSVENPIKQFLKFS